jgi:hypothetical protein
VSWDNLGPIISGIIILLVGLIIAGIVRWIIVWVFDKLRVSRYAKQVGLDQFVDVRVSYTKLLSDLAWWFVMLTALLSALDVAGVQAYGVFDKFISYIPVAILGSTVVVVGFVFANLLGRVAGAVAAWVNAGSAAIAQGAVRAAVVVVTAVLALLTFGVSETWVSDIILASIIALALAGGIGFGLGIGWNGANSLAGGLVKKWGDHWPKKE